MGAAGVRLLSKEDRPEPEIKQYEEIPVRGNGGSDHVGGNHDASRDFTNAVRFFFFVPFLYLPRSQG